MFPSFYFEEDVRRALQDIQRRITRIEHQMNIKDQDEHYCPTCGREHE